MTWRCFSVTLLGGTLLLMYPEVVLVGGFCGYTVSGLVGEVRLRWGQPEEIVKRKALVRTAAEEARRKGSGDAGGSEPGSADGRPSSSATSTASPESAP